MSGSRLEGFISLGDAKEGVLCRVVGFEGAGPLKTRALQMGLVPGTVVQVGKPAPMGDPISVRFRGMDVSLRREEAQVVRVEILSSCGGSCCCCAGGCGH
ncbi:Fe2+ transport system protein A [Thermanaerovibrio velox DSM 12556]|uniref:Fe2+ transport system protein A n=1 Tax=Thermanaerovibrio velox DSM 12556 TaxID=926567 RepID=H0UR39_9BACT|nr:FeoA family protein [Thermanaerovibrio velox]EHM10876.1 Fe2+ transport system protein A [Thermanaerovibrio velox DSM 12556]